MCFNKFRSVSVHSSRHLQNKGKENKTNWYGINVQHNKTKFNGEIFIHFIHSFRDFNNEPTKLSNSLLALRPQFCMQIHNLYYHMNTIFVLSFVILNGFTAHTIPFYCLACMVRNNNNNSRQLKREEEEEAEDDDMWCLMYSQYANSANGLNTWTITSTFETSHR